MIRPLMPFEDFGKPVGGTRETLESVAAKRIPKCSREAAK
jgi:hypothetical protein